MRATQVAVLTGSGAGALAVVKIWGPGAIRIADACFRPYRKSMPLSPLDQITINLSPLVGEGRVGSQPPAQSRNPPTYPPPQGGREKETSSSGLRSSPGRPRLGRLGAGLGDEVVAIVGPGESAEIQCHGGPAAVELVIEALVTAGAERAEASSWVRHQSPSALRTEAMLDLPHAATLRAAAHLLDQANGALNLELERLHTSMDLARLDALIARGRVGTRLREGWRVVLAGRPNVGKSRLLNALVGFDRAIVDPTPGTTRDVVTSATAFAGWPVSLSDTAGLRAAVESIEAEGVQRALARQRAADLVLLVLDQSEPLTDQDRALIAEYPTALVVANKVDLPPAWEGIGLAVSAERGDGIEELAIEIGRRLVPETIPAGSGMPFRPRHLRRLVLIRHEIVAGDLDRAARSLRRWLATGGRGSRRALPDTGTA